MPARPLSSSAARSRSFAAGLLLLACAGCFRGTLHAARRHPVLSAFDRAQQMRDALEALPEAQRTRADYAQLLDAYRTVYHNNPGDLKAQQSIDTVAVLLAEQGRIFHSEKTLHDAIAQCEFLRAQYPGGPFRSSALLMEASISLHDLHDRDAARTAYQKFLHDYPEDPLANQARAGLKEARHAARQSEAALPATDNTRPAADNVPPVTARSTHRSTVLDAARSSQSEQAARAAAATAPPTPQPHAPPPAHQNELSRLDTGSATVTNFPVSPRATAAPSAASAAAGQPVLTGATRVAAQQHRGRLPLVTNVRHWSTPVYTRVAIDLQDQVEYEAARVPNPDRIYFDLHGAKVAPELIGRSVDVTDDGFLQRIRVAQFSNDVTRVVLDVSQVSEYSAFFLPNPWRLIIDIHGARPGSGAAPTSAPPVQIAAAPAPSNAARQPQPVPTASQPGTQSARALHDIASLGNTPDKVKATRKPTTQPIAASVPGRARERASAPVTVVDDGPDDAESPATGAATNTAAARAPESRSQPTPSAADPHTTRRHPLHVDDGGADDRALGDADAVSTTTHDRPRTNTRDVAPQTPVPQQTSREAAREAASIDGQRSLTRALGLKIGRIVVDAGHGGHDSGTLGPGGIEVKTVVLDVALRLGKLLRQRMGADVTYTRDDDTFIPLETRTAIANKAQADLFISVHANSSPDPTARGVETYYLNFTTSPDALEVAARENAVSDQSVHELSGLVKKITLKDKIDESRTFAADVQQSLYTGLEQGNPGLRDRGVKKAPFVVLIGANMPSILAEISFLTNPGDATELRDPAYRQRIAESLYRGVARYVSGLSGLRVAQTSSLPRGN